MASLINKVMGKGKDAADVNEGTGNIMEAPVTHERVHHHTDHVDQTRNEDVRVKTDVNTVVQPVMDERREKGDTEVVNEGRVIREEGHNDMDAAARQELGRRRDEVAQTAGTTADHTSSEVDERPDVVSTEKHRTIQQVQPVIERDINVPHRVEHQKTDTKVVHEAPTFHGTEVAPAMTVGEFQNANHGAGAGASSHTSD